MIAARLAFYGSTRILRGFCPTCKCHAFIIDKRLQCCGRAVGLVDLQGSDNMITLVGQRRRFSIKARARVLLAQWDQCLYCDRPFGPDNPPHWDHFIPHTYRNDVSVYNLATACRECNRIKSDRIFDTLEGARTYVKTKRNR